ncbi:hypothetical protein BC941DRAFT_445973 [Chlamydoabsidia padenii]|nr:hypothetical protein BC941DRAFT_445973 [Chlamydoabsidia padenii]
MNELISNPAGQELRSTDRPMYGMASTNVNDTIYMYGGFYGVSPWNMEALWRMSSTVEPKDLVQVKTDPTASPVLIYSQLIYPAFSKYLYAFGGHHPTVADDPTNTTALLNATAHPEFLRYYQFDLAARKWAPVKSNQQGPLERYWHTATLSHHQRDMFLFGGMNITGPVNDFWKYQFQSNTWIQLPLPSKTWQARCGHSSNMLSNGKMVVLGGYDCVGNYTTNPVISKTLVSLDHALIYNTWTQTWSNQTLQGDTIPEPRTYHSAVTTKDDKVMICGGQDGAAQPFQTYISAAGDPSGMTAVLDTSQWTWMIPTPSTFQPFPRSFASAVLVNQTKVMVGFGINYHTIYDGMYVFDVSEGMWLPANPTSLKPVGTRLAMIAGLAVMGSFLGAFALVALVLVIKKIKSRLYEFGRTVKNDIWNPRAGEPLWTEMSRLLFRIIFLAVFLTVVGILILQVRNSPIIDQKYYVHNDDYTVDVPDIRFCFDGWTSDNSKTSPYIQCATDFGDSCSQYLIDISKHVETGLNYYGTKLHCYLFRAPPSFRLGRTNDRTLSNGSYLKFYYYGDRLPSNVSHLHLVFYNKYHNPNLPVYHIDDPYDLPFTWYSDSEDAQFQSAEEENLRTENSFDLNPNVGSTSSFATIEREEIKSTHFWNYIGIASVHKRAYEIDSKAVSESMTTIYATDPQPLGSLHVFPASYEVTVLREQRAFTVVNAMGIIGGIFGLIVGLQACLFGYRPRSPMGLIHRWGMGQMRWSQGGILLPSPDDDDNGLHSPVPLVNPVHRRFSELDPKRKPSIITKKDEEADIEKRPYYSLPNDNDNYMNNKPPLTVITETDEIRLARMEDRLQLMELLFKSYYINDEVFQSLDKAIRKEEIKRLASLKSTTDANASATATGYPLTDDNTGADNRPQNKWRAVFRMNHGNQQRHTNPNPEPASSLANPTRDFIPPS